MRLVARDYVELELDTVVCGHVLQHHRCPFIYTRSRCNSKTIIIFHQRISYYQTQNLCVTIPVFKSLSVDRNITASQQQNRLSTFTFKGDKSHENGQSLEINRYTLSKMVAFRYHINAAVARLSFLLCISLVIILD
jgi:hypothetical protein